MKLKTTILAAVLAAAATAQAGELVEPGFENGELGKWAVIGQDWRVTPETNETHAGHFAAVNDVLTENIDIYRVIYQEFKVKPGTRCEGGVWIRATDVESSESYFEIQFWDRYGVTIKQYQSNYVKGDQDYAYVDIPSAVAPPESVMVSVRLVVHMAEPPKKNADHHFFDDIVFTMTAPSP
ncbi:MAG TPA: hypothetical protein VIH35_03760 [Kiritimatiellia bacterium]|jgi:hypothetical protein